MSIDLRQMSFLLYWLIPSMMYFNMLFLDASVAQEPYYTELETTRIHDPGLYRFTNSTNGNSLFIPDIGFMLKIHQKDFSSLTAFKNEVFFLMANAFEHNNQMRSFEIVGANMDERELVVHTFKNALVINWNGLQTCSSHSVVHLNIETHVFNSGVIECHITGISSAIAKCPMTIKITEGIFNVNEDGNGYFVPKEVIYMKEFTICGQYNEVSIILSPQPRCLAQTAENACNAESTPNANCTWYRKYEKCFPDTLSCSCSDQTKITQPQEAESNKLDYIVVILLACVLVETLLLGMFVWKYYMTNH
uniref:Egg protein CP391S n=1 Tax=Schistosoma japonicum TaxID=6182 RepID=C7TXV4_SCHJA|nr:hypothetical protein [Schistosoma japonicum]